jgi:hypothetical protein
MQGVSEEMAFDEQEMPIDPEELVFDPGEILAQSMKLSVTPFDLLRLLSVWCQELSMGWEEVAPWIPETTDDLEEFWNGHHDFQCSP